MYYDRQIKYFDYKKSGVRLKGAGFLKMETRGENCTLLLQISGLQSVDNGNVQVYGLWEMGEELLGNILLQGGRGSKELCFTGKNMLLAIRIPLKDDCEIYCRIGEPETKPARRPDEDAEAETAPAETVVLREMLPGQEAPGESTEAGEASDEKQTSELVETEYEENEKLEKAPTPQPQPMLEEKWEQLWAVYPHLVPFEDEREYLQMGLGDFVILRERFYRLVHNSFLLHGFYNYRHLILTRLERRGESFFYIGVPGNFYDREKQVALMYGFESFECAKEPAGQGDFGYYMIRVEL